jgi:hypothetical protein
MAQTPAALKQGVQDLMSGFVNSPEAKKMYTSLPEMSQAIMSQNYKASAVLTKGATEATGALNRNTALAKAGLSNQVNADFAGLRDLEAKNRAQTAEQSGEEAKGDQDKLRKGENVDVNNQVALRQAQTATTLAMDNLVQKGVGPVTAGMLKLATGIEKVITETIPKKYIGEKTSTRDTGRGTETPAVAGYGTNFKPEDLAKFLEEAVAKGYKAITGSTAPVPPPVTTGRQAQEVLTRASGPRQTGPRSNMSNEQANNILQRAAAGPNTNYRTNLGDTTPTTEPTALAARESSVGGSADLVQGLMTLAQNIGSQTTSMNELVELMRRSNGIQDRILQQARN